MEGQMRIPGVGEEAAGGGPEIEAVTDTRGRIARADMTKADAWLRLFSAADELVGRDVDPWQVWSVLKAYLEHPEWATAPFADVADEVLSQEPGSL